MHDLASFIGRFHPLWVHVPIGILLLLVVLEGAGYLARRPRLSWLPVLAGRERTLILAIAASAAVLAACLGWLLSREGDYDPALLASHRFLGIAAACAAVAVLAVHRNRRLYPPALALSLVLIALAAHAGSKITLGADFLTAEMPPALARILGVSTEGAGRAPAVDFNHAAAFADVVRPIFQERCGSCHGPAKSNGGLRLDSWDLLVKGGKHGPVVKPGDLAASELVRRIELPLEERDHMPPRGKPQLADDDFVVLEWWVAAGAPRDARVSASDLTPLVEEILRGRLGGNAAGSPPDRESTLAEARQVASKLGIIIRPLTPDGPWIDVNARGEGRAFGDAELAQLGPVAPAVQWLDIGGTAVTDAGLSALAPMHGLRRLHLDGTRVTDDGLARLSGLKRLEYLNLRGTAVTDKGLSALRALPRLRALYLWQTAVTPGAAKALGESLVDRRRIARWQAEREELGREIQAEKFEANTGESLSPAPNPP